MKRIFPIFLSILLILGLFPAPAYAAPDWPSNISIEADGGVVMDADSGAVLFGKIFMKPIIRPASPRC